MQLSPHFALHEFASPVYLNPTGRKRATHRETPPALYRANLRRLCKALETIRAEFDAGLHIVSGWRSAEFNRRNKGRASRSQHLFGRAADLQLLGGPPAGARFFRRQLALFFAIQALQQRDGRIPRGGLAFYPGRVATSGPHRGKIVGTFTHYDIRGRNARWQPDPAANTRGPQRR